MKGHGIWKEWWVFMITLILKVLTDLKLEPHERIVASVIYYYDTDSAIEDGGLSFRKFRDDRKDWPKTDMGESQYNHKVRFFRFEPTRRMYE